MTTSLSILPGNSEPGRPISWSFLFLTRPEARACFMEKRHYILAAVLTRLYRESGRQSELNRCHLPISNKSRLSQIWRSASSSSTSSPGLIRIRKKSKPSFPIKARRWQVSQGTSGLRSPRTLQITSVQKIADTITLIVKRYRSRCPESLVLLQAFCSRQECDRPRLGQIIEALDTGG